VQQVTIIFLSRKYHLIVALSHSIISLLNQVQPYSLKIGSVYLHAEVKAILAQGFSTSSRIPLITVVPKLLKALPKSEFNEHLTTTA